MTQEQKAKAYDKLIDQALDIYSQSNEAGKMTLEILFPELAESEDSQRNGRCNL